MVALFVTGLATGAAVVLEIQKRSELNRRNKELEAALKEVRAERDTLLMEQR